MNTFANHKSSKKIKAQCAEQGWHYSQEKYDQGSDYVSFQFIHEEFVADVLYNTFNGTAFGKVFDKEGNETRFDTQSTEHEDQPWFQALLEFIYE